MEPLDPRSVANTILALAEEYNFEVTQLSLQKIIYFVHGRFLVENGQPLVAGYFEAWPYGPVHPVIYAAFRKAGAAPLNFKATIKDLLSGEESVVDESDDRRVRLFIRETAVRYLRMSPGRLVELSHARRSPWDITTGTHSGDRQYGARISNELISGNFKFHKISVGAAPRLGEPDEETLPSGN